MTCDFVKTRQKTGRSQIVEFDAEIRNQFIFGGNS